MNSLLVDWLVHGKDVRRKFAARYRACFQRYRRQAQQLLNPSGIGALERGDPRLTIDRIRDGCCKEFFHTWPVGCIEKIKKSNEVSGLIRQKDFLFTLKNLAALMRRSQRRKISALERVFKGAIWPSVGYDDFVRHCTEKRSVLDLYDTGALRCNGTDLNSSWVPPVRSPAEVLDFARKAAIEEAVFRDEKFWEVVEDVKDCLYRHYMPCNTLYTVTFLNGESFKVPWGSHIRYQQLSQDQLPLGKRTINGRALLGYASVEEKTFVRSMGPVKIYRGCVWASGCEVGRGTVATCGHVAVHSDSSAVFVLLNKLQHALGCTPKAKPEAIGKVVRWSHFLKSHHDKQWILNFHHTHGIRPSKGINESELQQLVSSREEWKMVRMATAHAWG